MKALTDEDKKSLAEVAELARQGDKDGVVARLVNVGLSLASEVPVLGTLGETGIRALLERTSMGRMRKALAEVTTETSQLEAAQQVARLVAELLGEELHDLHADQQAIAEALARLDAQLKEVLRELAGVDRVHILLVDGGATGATLEGGERRAVEIREDRVTGRGTIGVHIKAKPPR
jgi:hypothetical protein